MKPVIISLFIFLLSSSKICLAQNINIQYEVKFRPDPKKDIILKNIYFLDIYGKQSIFRNGRERKADSAIAKTGLGLGGKILTFPELHSRKNLENGEILKIFITPFMRSRFFITIKDKLSWKIVNEKQKIGDLDCQKAELEYGGRKWIAWFAQSITLQEGPYIFNGLPGLIVKISDSKLDYEFNLIQIKNSNSDDYYLPQRGKEIDWEQFQKMALNYYNDPFYEVKSSGLPITFGDDNGNVLKVNRNNIDKKARENFKENGYNLLEIDKAIDLK